MKKIAFTLLFVLLPLVAVAKFEVSRWQFKKDLVPAPGVGSAPFGEVTFDSEVFSKANANLSDARIVDDQGAEVPYVLVTEAPKASRKSYPVKILNKGVQEGDFTVFTADLGREGIFHNELEIVTDSKNFRRQAAVEASADGVSWLTVGEKSIYDYSYEFHAKDTSVGYPDSTLRFLRVKIFDRGENPIKVLGATVYFEERSSGKEVRYPSTLLGQVEDTDRQVSIATFDLGVKGLPTSRVSLGVGSENFNREVALETSNDNLSWAAVASRDVIFSYDTPKFRGNKLSLSYPEANARYFRLIVFNKDDAPIAIRSAEFTGLLRKLVFAYDSERAYTLYYGNSAARFPEYDLKNYLAYYDAASRTAVSLGSEVVNQSYRPPEKPVSERYSSLLMSALVLAVLLIGFLIFRLFKRTGVS